MPPEMTHGEEARQGAEDLQLQGNMFTVALLERLCCSRSRLELRLIRLFRRDEPDQAVSNQVQLNLWTAGHRHMQAGEWRQGAQANNSHFWGVEGG